jgi:acyl-[acyl-carrier-protein]-phospholipid O-acyltransferase/long-chain-fatty-acid--[acyl-carrier-protein] ligase
MKLLLRLLLRACFRYRAYNQAVLRTPGPVLLIPNHVSWIDWLFLGALLDDDWRFVTSISTAETSWLHRKIMTCRRTIPVDTHSPFAVRVMEEYLEAGGRLVLFAEGRISVTGSLMRLFDGTGFLIRKAGAKVITCHLRGANRIWFVKHTGWRKLFPRVSAHFSEVLRPPVLDHLSHAEARRVLTDWVRDRMVLQQFEVETEFGAPNVLAAVAETAGKIPRRIALEDFNRGVLSYRRLMIATEVLSGAWRRLGAAPDGRVGVLLPNVNGMPVTILSLWAAGRIPALLNFSAGIRGIRECVRLAGLKHIVTSRRFLEKAGLDLGPLAAKGVSIIYLEDVRAGLSGWAKASSFIRNAIAPGARLRAAAQGPGDSAVILYTSGSEGVPKGVELTHGNLLANIRQATAVVDLADDDRFFNAMPIFHSYGLNAGTLFPMVRGCYTYLYPSPLHYRTVPALVYDRSCTVLLGTNTFLNGYARKAHAYDFNSVRLLFSGAEKVHLGTLDTWSRRFGVRILEGYGATECSPFISVNTRIHPECGSVGRLLPGMELRLEPVQGVEEGGRLFVRGPNVMKGYLNADADAAFQALGGWYDTGDVVHVNSDGFLFIRGRLKRFAKISGEMVSLTAVEDALDGAFPHYGARCRVAVQTRPDEERGESLIALTDEPRLQLSEVRAAVRARGLSNLCAPRELVLVPEIPRLGTGKTDHPALARLAASANGVNGKNGRYGTNGMNGMNGAHAVDEDEEE